jgi:thioredoxin-related protein
MKLLLRSLALLPIAASSIYASDWTTDYKAALVQARAQHKLALLDFTGSDWCQFCKSLEEEVLTQPEFQRYAVQTFVLVTIDFPRKTQLPDDLKRQNAELEKEFQPNGFPTLVVVDSDGKQLGRIVGYDPGSGPQAVIDELRGIVKDIKYSQ